MTLSLVPMNMFLPPFLNEGGTLKNVVIVGDMASDIW